MDRQCDQALCYPVDRQCDQALCLSGANLSTAFSLEGYCQIPSVHFCVQLIRAAGCQYIPVMLVPPYSKTIYSWHAFVLNEIPKFWRTILSWQWADM